MKKFSIKDFISYNNPCFSCGMNVSIEIVAVELGVNSSDKVHRISPVVKPDHFEANLKMLYHKSLSIKIYPHLNRFDVSDVSFFQQYLNKHKIYLRSQCSNCVSYIDGQYLDFNFKKNFIKAFGISQEILFVNDNSHTYNIYSFYATDTSNLYIVNNKLNVINLSIPLFPLSKFKNKEKFCDKVKTYLAFS